MMLRHIAGCAPLILFASAALAGDPAAAPAVRQCPDGAVESRLFPLFLVGNRAGYHRECRMPDGAGIYIFEFNDRGRGPSVRSRIVQDAAGMPTSLSVDGNDYLKNPIAERFSIVDGKAAWTNKVETGERLLEAPAFYLSQSGTAAELPMLAKALLSVPGQAMQLLPSGEARLEPLAEHTVKQGDAAKPVRLYALHGLGYQPTTIWLDLQGAFFASVDSWIAIVAEGWEPVIQELLAIQEQKLSELRRAQAARLRQPPRGPLVIERANLFDAETGTMK
ncbi:MAG: hypothetical protein ACREST_08375, partial [Steroidobacteraceae bacterium]